jgi:hypothetical protein
MGGYNSSRGTTSNCTIINNTFYLNNTLDGAEQITFQHHVNTNTVRNNIVVANSSRLILATVNNTATSTFTGNVFSHNLYYSASGSPLFNVGGSKALSTWQGSTSLSGGDTGSTAENPLFEETTPTINTSVRGYRPAANSPAINTGQPSPPYQAGSGELDMSGHARFRGGRVDRGAFER